MATLCECKLCGKETRDLKMLSEHYSSHVTRDVKKKIKNLLAEKYNI